MLDQLEKLAKAATPGPWSAEQSSAINPFRVGSSDEWVANGVDLSSDNDMKYIAAASPDTVLKLIAVARAAHVVAFAVFRGDITLMPDDFDYWAIRGLREAFAALEEE